MSRQLRLVPHYEVIVCAPEESFRWYSHDYPWHLAKFNYHPEYELHLNRISSGTMMVGDYLGEFGPGNLVLTGPNVPHNWVSNIAPGEVVRTRDMLIQFTPNWAEKIATLCPELGTIRALYDDAAWGVEFTGETARAGAALLEEIGGATGPERFFLFLRLMERLAREPAERRRLSRQAPLEAATMTGQLDRAVRFLNENMSEDVDLATVAAKAGLTPQTFSRAFKRQTGHTFASYLVMTRVYAACTALTQSHAPVTDICFDVGFNSIANFNRQFLKITGRTPSDYRKVAHRIAAEGRAEAETGHISLSQKRVSGGKG
jgi:AraC-like DNA-binding protein